MSGIQKSAIEQFDNKCFLIMPFGAPGSDLEKKSRAVMENFIRPIIEKKRYKLLRADDIGMAGSITRDIIEFLNSSDLVIADLSGHNANVFYELGVRHALRPSGTISIIEAGSRIPFDVSPYRTIHYEHSKAGIGKFQKELKSHVDSFEKLRRIDNPVHDILLNEMSAGHKPIDAETIGRIEAACSETVWIVILESDFYHLSLDTFKPVTITNLKKGVNYRFVVPDTPECRNALELHFAHCVQGASTPETKIGSCEYRWLPREMVGILVPLAFFDVYKSGSSGYIRTYQQGKHSWVKLDQDRLWRAVEGFAYVWNHGKQQTSP